MTDKIGETGANYISDSRKTNQTIETIMKIKKQEVLIKEYLFIKV